MKILSHIRKYIPFGLRSWGLLLVLALSPFVCAQAQLVINGNVYGGGDKGDVGGSTTVQLISGNIGTENLENPGGSVFGGARMANVKGSAMVNIDGVTEGTTNYIVANRVYGGNDISGTIGSLAAIQDTFPSTLLTNAATDGVDSTWNAFVHLSSATTTVNDTLVNTKNIYIGQLFGGGNGEYDYKSDTTITGITYYVKQDSIVLATSDVPFKKPVIDKTYLDIQGGSIVYAYGGGNAATVQQATVISMNNPSAVVNSIKDTRIKTTDEGELLTTARFKAMGINTGYSKPSSDAFQIGRMFGGNNQAEMAIRPTWHLEGGKVRNLYSGGNKGAMTNTQGLLLDIDPDKNNPIPLVIDYVYGGCRMADVHPLHSGTLDDNPVDAAEYEIQLDPDLRDKSGNLYSFPAGLPARLVIRGGQINNVYGGNDVTGRVYGGNAVGIHTSIGGDVYGGGNGSYPYTDNPDFEGDDIYGDFYYGNYYDENSSSLSLERMNAFRPDAEQVSIHIKGTEQEKTIIHGSVYLGGNSATIKTQKEDPLVQLKIGSYVIADKVFMGNNGESMVTSNDRIVDDNNVMVEREGILQTLSSSGKTSDYLKFNSINLVDVTNFSKYMEGAAMSLNPSASKRLVFDDDYVDYSTMIGSFYCGGNVGSMTYTGTQTMNFNVKVRIYDKIVGGCNNADVPKTQYNAAYEGGILGSSTEQESYTDSNGNIKDRLVLNFNGTRIEPKRWNDTFEKVDSGTILTAGKTYYTTNLRSGQFTAYMDTANSKHRYWEITTQGDSLIPNTAKWDEDLQEFWGIGTDLPDDDADRRLLGGNIYGGCYNSGHVNGNVVINIEDDLIERYGNEELGLKGLFADATPDDDDNMIISGQRRTGVILDNQANDVNTIAMTVFGAGKGKLTEIWGGTTVNLNKGYTLQIFGGGEEGYVGKGDKMTTGTIYDGEGGDGNGYYLKDYNKFKNLQDDDPLKLAYSSKVNLNASDAVYNGDDDAVAEAEFLYGAGNEGDVCGNSYVYLGNGRIYDAFGGASDANVYGHTEVYIGRNMSGEDKFPYIRDIVYGGNDFGGTILGEGDMSGRVRATAMDMVYNPNNAQTPDVLKASSYVEYLQGYVDTIFGGSYGHYDYFDTLVYGYADDELKTVREMPKQKSSFVNIRPNNNNNNNTIHAVFGAGTGYMQDRRGDSAQDRSYVLIDIPEYAIDEQNRFRYTQIFGAGAYNGLGMRYTYAQTTDAGFNLDNASAIVDLISGQVGAAYGASFMEGVTRRTMVNVPQGSTINIGSIFGGGFGSDGLYPCDAYESNVNYSSDSATLVYNPGLDKVNDSFKGSIYGGNNNARRTVYGKVNISAKVNSKHYKYGSSTGYIYGAGCGPATWSQYTEVNLLPGAQVYEVYGGGQNGTVLNAETIGDYMNSSAHKAEREAEYRPKLPNGATTEETTAYNTYIANVWLGKWDKLWNASWRLGEGYDPANVEDFKDNTPTNLSNPLVRTAEIDDRAPYDADNNPLGPKPSITKKYNANVIIWGADPINNKPAAKVNNYAYGGGYGENAVVSGTTYIALLGGEVSKDIYAAGTSGPVIDMYGSNDFIASTTAYIQGGTVRNVYGGGWRGSVGFARYKAGPEIYHKNDTIRYEQIPDFYVGDSCTDVLGESHVVIGRIDGYTYADGVPSIRRNVYGGGEGGAIYGTAYTTINNGYIGYSYKNTEADVYDYVEENDDAVAGDNLLASHGGNVFGGGYVANSYVDTTDIKMFGGTIRGSLFGGGEIAPVGRGTVKDDSPGTEYPANRIINHDAKIYKAGKTQVRMYSGQVGKNVFGGGRGYDNWEGDGWMDNIEKVTMDLSSKGYVFGTTQVYIYGGKIGTKENVRKGDGNVFGGGDEGFVYSGIGTKDTVGYYYNGSELTEDCKVVVSPYAQIKPIKILADIVKPGENNVPDTLFKAGEYTTIPEFQSTIPASIKATLAKGNQWNYDNTTASTVGSNTYYPITATANLADPSQAFIPTDDLNEMSGNNSDWENCKIDRTGIIVGNAVFAGGNVSPGSDNLYVNTTAVYGNATASVTDVFAKDLITIGEDGIGGLYGDGNMTFVDGYRELNITNYGTDYYNLDESIDIDEYERLSDRERAYFELLYTPKNDRSLSYYECTGTHPVIIDDEVVATYKRGQKIPLDELTTLQNYVNRTAGTANPYTIADHWKKQEGIVYTTQDRLPKDEWDLFWDAEKEQWGMHGFCTLYAGRMINTIQRADFCGVFGSRVVMRGAQDRVPKKADYTEYTINRVKEVSLNAIKKGELDHGNYFGIYNVVNYLGALTSNVDFWDVRQSTNNDYKADGTTTYVGWKQANLGNKKRNYASSLNEVALASGVWLEILDEKTETSADKVYGPITGIVELTLLNVAPGEGGGYVYAKNQHGAQKYDPNMPVTLLSEANKRLDGEHARSQVQYTYGTALTPEQYGDLHSLYHTILYNKMQSSGNFVNPTKRIIDDCYPYSGAYYNRNGQQAAPAHYWYIRGDYYVYDQYISAYTGSAQSYAENVTIPLTITAEAQGKLQLINVKENHYAYWADFSNVPNEYKSKTTPNAILVGGKTYKLNDPITFWDWNHLNSAEQSFFTKMTWICSNEATINGTTYPKDSVLLPQDISSIKDYYVCKEDLMDTTGVVILKKDSCLSATQYADLSSENQNKCAKVFNITNTITHDDGFLLTFDWDNPDVWNDYYHSQTGDLTMRSSQGDMPHDYITSPSFKFKTGNDTIKRVLGQFKYSVDDVIDSETYTEQTAVAQYVPTNIQQATFDEVYIMTASQNYTASDGKQYLPGACIPKACYDTLSNDDKTQFDEGKLCTVTFEYKLAGDAESEYMFTGTVIPVGDATTPGTYNYFVAEAAKTNSNVPNPIEYFSKGYICTKDGSWGGTLFEGNRSYPAIYYSNLNKEERFDEHNNPYFTYNYDALDLIVDPTYSSKDGLNGTVLNTSMYDKPGGPQLYSKQQSIDYEATYTGSSPLVISNPVQVVWYEGDVKHVGKKDTIKAGYTISNHAFEDTLINEAVNYTPILVKGNADTTYYVVKQGLQVGDKWYSPGNQMTPALWDGLDSVARKKVVEVKRSDLQTDILNENDVVRFYFCTNGYDAVSDVEDIKGKLYGPNRDNKHIEPGTIIYASKLNDTIQVGYDHLKNQQVHFSINGRTPTETSTLYVARGVDINDLSQDKIITAVYYYDYVEGDDSGNSYEKIREYHVVNVHVHFESGMPSVSELKIPDIVLPGDEVKLNQPTVSKGAYEILGGGWEIYENAAMAERHRNGVQFSTTTPLYWYQDGYMVAYYALSYLGKTYSNAVPLSVANYHRMDEVITFNTDTIEDPFTGDKTLQIRYYTDDDYMYLNKAVKSGKRDPKVYVGSDTELNKFAVFYDKTHSQTGLSNIKDGSHLDIILDSDISHTGTWTSIGGSGNGCFNGTLHGDGYTISGLSEALFGSLCGDIYNLGVTGTFTDAGIANAGEGYIENSWISSTSKAAKEKQPIFGSPGRSSDDPRGLIQVVNSYYMEDYNDAYQTVEDETSPKEGSYTWQIEDRKKESDYVDHGTPIRKDTIAFYNGEVAYNLNGFYLNKRYYDGIGSSIDYDGGAFTSNPKYLYIDPEMAVDSVTSSPEYKRRQLKVITYDTNKPQFGDYGYVEDRYADGDFRYAGGTIPTWTDDRERTLIYTDENQKIEKTIYAPIWPDDYLFFGQNLTFGYVDERPHDETPVHYSSTNRVYRAPAYYGDSKMDVAYFNPNAVLADKEALTADDIVAGKTARKAFPGMTAIDLTGKNDVTGNVSDFYQGLKESATANDISRFYTPLLDFGGLTGFRNDGQTKNMLVYAPFENDNNNETETTGEKTLNVLNNYLVEPDYFKYAYQLDEETGEPTEYVNNYNNIRKVSDNDVSNVHGHLVLKYNDANDPYKAATDQFLVDKNVHNEPFDFNASLCNGLKDCWHCHI